LIVATQSEFENAEIFVAVYSSEAEAQSTLDTIKELEKQGTLDIIDAATLERDQEGKVKVHHRESTTKKGTTRGVVVGAVLGAIFPPSILASAVGFGALGAVIGHFRDKPFDNKELKGLGVEIEPGQAAVIAVVQDKSIQQFANALEGYDKLFRKALDAQTAGELAVVVDKATGEGEVAGFVTSQEPMATSDASSMGASATSTAVTPPTPPPDTTTSTTSDTASQG